MEEAEEILRVLRYYQAPLIKLNFVTKMHRWAEEV